MNTLEKMRRSFGSVLISAIWLNVGLIAARTLWTGEQPAILIGGALLIATASTATWLNDKVGVATRIVTSMALTMTIILLVFSFSGHPYQVDLHMYFFACLAMTTVWCDWRAQVASAGTTAVHHILLNFLLPSAVYPGGADVLRLVVHAVILVTELGVLIWLSIQLNNLFATGEALLTEASQNARDARAIADERDEARKAQTVAADWRNSQTELFTKRMGDVSEAFIATASKLSVAARSLSTISERTETLTDTVSGVAQKASESTHTVAASTEEMSSSIRDIAAKVAQSSAVANSAAEEAANTETDVRELQVAASKIGEVVDLINNIAGQTNLLALNATIEAARAGESGRGFAVVASEVKQLASQTAKATEEIAAKIAEIRSATDRTVGSIDKIVATVSQIREISNEISSAIAEQGTATNEIALATQRAADGTSEVTTIILDVGQSAKKTGETSDLLLDLSNGLTRTAEALKLEVTGFVETIQAA